MINETKTKTMTTYNNKQEAKKQSDMINNNKGFKISDYFFIGNSMIDIYGVTKSGWYVSNKENKKIY